MYNKSRICNLLAYTCKRYTITRKLIKRGGGKRMENDVISEDTKIVSKPRKKKGSVKFYV